METAIYLFVMGYALRRDVSSLVIHTDFFGNVHDCVQESGNGCL